MARIPMVTRTIKTTKVTVLCLDVNTCEPSNETVTLARTFKDEEKLLKAAKELIETPEKKVVHVVGKEELETLYGMTEMDFIQHAGILPPRTTKEDI